MTDDKLFLEQINASAALVERVICKMKPSAQAAIASSVDDGGVVLVTTQLTPGMLVLVSLCEAGGGSVQLARVELGKDA